jgi:hypothetical protein
MRALARINPYYGPLYDAWRQLVALNGVLFQFSTHVNQRKADLEVFMKRRKRPFFAAAALVIMDLTSVQPDGFPVVFPVGGQIRKGRRYLTMLDEIEAREAAWTVAQAFEAFETATMDSAALFLKRNPQQLGSKTWHKRSRNPTNRAPTSKRLSDHRSFVRTTYRSANETVKRLGDSLPDLRHAEAQNHRSLSLSDWLDALAAVRHATVHNSGILSAKQISRLGPAKVKVLRIAFPGRLMKGGYRLNLGAKDADEALKILAEYAFLIYKAASSKDGLDERVFLQGRIAV